MSDAPDDPPPPPAAARVLARAALAGLVTELVLAEVAAPATGEAWTASLLRATSALGFGVGAGVAFGLAELAARRAGALAGLLALAALSVLAPLGGAYGVEWGVDFRSLAATERLLAVVAREGAATVALAAALVTLLEGPLLVARARGASVPGQVAAMSGGGLAVVLALLSLPVGPSGLAIGAFVVLVAVRCAALPLALAVADRLVAAVRELGAAPPLESLPERRVATAALPLALLAVCLVLAGPRLHEPLELTRARVRAWTGSVDALVEHGLLLLREPAGPTRPVASLWPSAAFLPQPGAGLVREDEAREVLTRAAEQGAVPAMLRLARLEPEPSSERWLRRAAEAGNAQGMLLLGERLLYPGGPGSLEYRVRAAQAPPLSAREEEGRRWLRAAAGAGDDGATLLLGEHLASRREREGVRWLRQVAPREPASRRRLHDLLILFPEERRASDDAWLEELSSAEVPASAVGALRPTLALPAPWCAAPAVLLLERGQVALARAHAEHALRRDPRDVAGHTVLGVLRVRQELEAGRLRDAALAIAWAHFQCARSQAPWVKATELNVAILGVYEHLVHEAARGRDDARAHVAENAVARVLLLDPADPELRAARAEARRVLGPRQPR